MKLLLDTHMLIWAAAGILPKQAYDLVTDGENEICFSSASIWEIVIKRSLGRSDFTVDPQLLLRGLLDNDYRELAVTSSHVLRISDLPAIHKDPFDRLLLAQAKAEGILLVTADKTLAQYQAPVLFIEK